MIRIAVRRRAATAAAATTTTRGAAITAAVAATAAAAATTTTTAAAAAGLGYFLRGTTVGRDDGVDDTSWDTHIDSRPGGRGSSTLPCCDCRGRSRL